MGRRGESSSLRADGTIGSRPSSDGRYTRAQRPAALVGAHAESDPAGREPTRTRTVAARRVPTGHARLETPRVVLLIRGSPRLPTSRVFQRDDDGTEAWPTASALSVAPREKSMADV